MNDSDRAGRTPLHYAALNNDVEQVIALLRDGADVDAADVQGFTPLHFACQEWSVAAARILLEGGASVDGTNRFGNTPLFVAVFNSRGRGEIIQILREKGADPLYVNHAGQSPSGLARLIGNFEIAKYFTDLPED